MWPRSPEINRIFRQGIPRGLFFMFSDLLPHQTASSKVHSVPGTFGKFLRMVMRVSNESRVIFCSYSGIQYYKIGLKKYLDAIIERKNVLG